MFHSCGKPEIIHKTVIQLVRQYLHEEGYAKSSKYFKKESKTDDELPGPEVFAKGSLVKIIQDGMRFQKEKAESLLRGEEGK